MSLSDRKEQVEQLKKRVSEGKDINVSEEFDGLVDYLNEHGYKIKKQRFPPTTEERTREHVSELSSVKVARTPTEIERSLKKASKRLQSDVMNVWETELAEAAARCRVYGENRDFKELINYIKAGQSIKNQTTKTDE